MRLLYGPCLALTSAALMMGGCGGAGNETSTPPPTQAGSGSGGPVANAPESSGPAGRTNTASADDGSKRKGGSTTELTTPDRAVDPKSLVDVVREEVKGGEAKEGPSPSDYLWQMANEEMVKDEPLEVTVPKGLPQLIANATVPGANPLTKDKYELGRQLYFDQRVSLDGTVSCATCHNPEKGWTDNLKTSVGIEGQVGGRNAPTVINTAYGKTMFWDGRAPSLEGQAQGPIQNSIEMGEQSYKQIIERLRKISGYREQFQKVFGTDVTLDGFAKAVANFERVAALSGNSKYDRYAGGENDALSESEKRGMILFGLRLNPDDEFKTDTVLKKAECTSCHAGFNFTDEQFHNIGVGWNEKERKFADLGRWAITPIGAKNPAEMGAFKTPTVRDVTRTAPYMHDGSQKTLEEVVEHYNKGGNKNPSLDKDMKELKLNDQEKADLVAFMKTLTGELKKVELPKLPVGPDGKSPNPADALKAPGPKTAMGLFHPPAVR